MTTATSVIVGKRSRRTRTHRTRVFKKSNSLTRLNHYTMQFYASTLCSIGADTPFTLNDMYSHPAMVSFRHSVQKTNPQLAVIKGRPNEPTYPCGNFNTDFNTILFFPSEI